MNELLGLWGEFGLTPKMDKYAAIDPSVILNVVARVKDTDTEAAELIRWLTWWVQFKTNGCAWREREIANLIEKGISAVNPEVQS